MVLSFMILGGIAILAIPWFLTPPAFLDLVLRDSAFGADLSRHQVTVTDEATGKMMTLPIRRAGGAFVASIGRVNSGKGAFRAVVTGYQPRVARIDATALQTLRTPVDLIPTFGRVEITPVSAIRRDEPVPATMKEGTRVLTQERQRTVVVDLPPGKHRLSAEAPGFCPSDREYDVVAGKVTKAVLPLSPDLKDDEIARFVLGWKNEPRDLDSHFFRPPVLSILLDTHLYYGRKRVESGGQAFATLDVDELYPGKYETVTVRSTATGHHRYVIHRYAGFGTIADADARVEVYTRGCRMQTFTPPQSCSQNVWKVADLQNVDGRVDLMPLDNCEEIPERPSPKPGY